MATAHTYIERIEFIIEPEITICNIFYSSDEPGTPWGGGWKTKSFPGSKPIVDFITEECPDYIMWADGRVGVDLTDN